MLIFHKITNVFWGKCAFNQTLDMKWIETTFKYCILTLISSLEQKRSNIQCKIWNCPLYPCFQCTVPPPQILVLWKMLINVTNPLFGQNSTFLTWNCLHNKFEWLCSSNISKMRNRVLASKMLLQRSCLFPSVLSKCADMSFVLCKPISGF